MSSKLIAVTVAFLTCLSGAAASAQAPSRAPPAAGPPAVIPNRIFLVEQVVTGKLPAPLMQQLPPLKTLRQVEELLKANSIAYGWRKVELNTATVPPEVMRQIDALPPGEVFVIPAGETLTMNVIVGRKQP